LAGAVVGQGRLGVGVLSLIATLREEGRLPIATIQWYLRTLHGWHLSVGAIMAACATVAARGQAAIADIQASIRASPVVHHPSGVPDETGWRENGRNGYVWTFSTFSTPGTRLFVRGSRAKVVLEQALGECFGGVVVSDFSVAYTSYEGCHQDCWAHLLRDVDDLTAAQPQAAGVRGWADAVHQLYPRAVTFTAPDPAARRQAQRHFERGLATLCGLYLGRAEAPQRTLCERITKHLSALFVFVADPAVPPTNNAAEPGARWALRHLVTARKISGGPQDQWRPAWRGRHRHQNGAGHALRHLALARPRPP
jgi:hypothetical protein